MGRSGRFPFRDCFLDHASSDAYLAYPAAQGDCGGGGVRIFVFEAS
jgi:hypothetical protein